MLWSKQFTFKFLGRGPQRRSGIGIVGFKAFHPVKVVSLILKLKISAFNHLHNPYKLLSLMLVKQGSHIHLWFRCTDCALMDGMMRPADSLLPVRSPPYKRRAIDGNETKRGDETRRGE